MNKQVISFLSLFSLVLVLSVYYVVVPSNNDQTVNGSIDSNGELNINDASSLFFQTLIENRNSRHEEVKNAQLEILVSSEYSNEEKIEARSKLTQEQLIEDTEIGLENCIIELNFNETFVEKLDDYFYVTVYDGSFNDDNDVLNVLKIIENFDNYFEVNNLSDMTYYQPVVNFVTF